MESQRQGTPAHNVNWGRIIVAGLLVIVIAALVADNTDDTRIGYVFGDVNAPLFVLLIAAAILGAIIGWLVLHRPRRHDA